MKSFKVPISQKCFYCTAGCCSDVVLEHEEPDSLEEHDEIREYLSHENVFVYIDEEEWHVGFKTSCGAIQADYSCGVYAKRPEICREHSPSDCSEYTGPGKDEHRSTYYDAHFTTPEEFNAWLVEEGYESLVADVVPPAESPTPNHIELIQDDPEDFEDFDNFRWYLYHENVFIYIDEEEDWFVGFKTTDVSDDDLKSDINYSDYFSSAEAFDSWLIENNMQEYVRGEDEKEIPFEAKNMKQKMSS